MKKFWKNWGIFVISGAIGLTIGLLLPTPQYRLATNDDLDFIFIFIPILGFVMFSMNNK